MKRRNGYGYPGTGFSSGLWNSARFAVELLQHEGYPARLVEVVDNNDIDREVSLFKADIVIIEALWVVPEKFTVLAKLHPHVKWVIRYHSELPFLAHEGIAIDWLKQYVALPNVFVAHNTTRGYEDFREIVAFDGGSQAGKVLFLPTYYPAPRFAPKPTWRGRTLNAVCPGALRPFKNHLNQAVAAMLYAEQHGAVLNFHINASRVEQGGESVLRNLQSLFAGTRHNLIELPWVEHDEFIKELKHLDLGLQVSFTETFDICAADIVAAGLPLVASPQVRWTTHRSQADPNDVRAIAEGIRQAFKHNRRLTQENVNGLIKQAGASRVAWLQALRSL